MQHELLQLRSNLILKLKNISILQGRCVFLVQNVIIKRKRILLLVFVAESWHDFIAVSMKI